MRVASRTVYDMVKFNLANIREELNRANRIVATGKRIYNLSDDPVGLVQALNIRSNLSNIDQLGRNITLGNSWLAASESALNYVHDLISEAKDLSVQMATATAGQAQRATSANNVQNILEEIVSLANTQTNGRYVFSGSKTDAAPFSPDGTYTGNNSPFSIGIGRGKTFAVGNDGNAVFGNIFTTLKSFKTALEANDVNGIQAAIDNLDTDFDQISNTISIVGAKASRMEIRQNIFEDLKITNTERLSKLEDADLVEAITDLRSRELSYQAALAASAKVMGLSLVDYV